MTDHALGQEWVECAFCGLMMEPSGWDPCSVEVSAAREVEGRRVAWQFGAHSACLLASFHPAFRASVAPEYEFPTDE